ncbi:MAG: hypothetical protein JRG73_10050 [Deltaproteobacteria bacterium]|nr:hypothetical protein [Deltaproteobacteria bacterium]
MQRKTAFNIETLGANLNVLREVMADMPAGSKERILLCRGFGFESIMAPYGAELNIYF